MTSAGTSRAAVGGVGRRVWVWARARRGLLAVLVLFACFGLLNVLGVPTLLPLDERGHLGYALVLADGELPTIDTPLPESVFSRDATHYFNSVWVANHPPLYYALAAPFARLGLELGGVELAIIVVRCLSLALGVVALCFVHAIALLLGRGRRDFALLATLVTASVPHVLHVCALVHNDALALASAAASCYAALLVGVRGYSHARVAALALAASLAMLTRFTSIVAVVPAIGIACAAVLLHEGVPLRRRLAQSLASGALVLAATLASSGWFYARNLRLYDDVTGGAALFDKLGRTPRDGMLSQALDYRLWMRIYQDLWTRFGGELRLDGPISELAWLILYVALAGLGLALVRRVRRGRVDWLTPTSVALTGLAFALALAFAAMFEFYARGGSLHARYLIPLLWVPALAVAWGYCTLGQGAVRALIAMLCLLDLLVFSAYFDQVVVAEGDRVALVRALQGAGIVAAEWVVAIMLIAMALSLAALFAALAEPDERRAAIR